MYFPGRVLKSFLVSALFSALVLALSGCIDSKTDLHSPHIISDTSKYAYYDGWVFQTEGIKDNKETSYLWVSFEKPNKLKLIGLNKEFKTDKGKNASDGALIIKYIAAIPGMKNDFLIGIHETSDGYRYFAFRLDEKNTLLAVFTWGDVATVPELVKKVNDKIASKDIIKYTPLSETDRQKVLAKVKAQNPQLQEQ